MINSNQYFNSALFSVARNFMSFLKSFSSNFFNQPLSWSLNNFYLNLTSFLRKLSFQATNRWLHSNSTLTCKSEPCVCKCDGDAEKNNFERMNHVVVEGISLVLRESNLWLISTTPCIDYWFPARLMSSLDVVYESLHYRFDIVPFSLSTRLHLHILCNRNQRPAPNLRSRLLAVARSNWEIGGKAPKEKLKNCFFVAHRNAKDMQWSF